MRRKKGGAESEAHREKYEGDNMSDIGSITSRADETSASLTTRNRIAIFIIVAAAIAAALYLATSYIARNKAAQLKNARLIETELKGQDLRITEIKTDSEERTARVKAEMEQHMAMLAAEAAKTRSEIARANKRTEAEQLERMRLEVEMQERLTLLAAEAAKTRSEIARANERAQAEQLERVRLEAELAPRTIEQRQSAKELSEFQGINVIVESLAESEPWRTAGQLAWLLSNANWNILPGMKRFLDAARFRDGVIIETNGEDRPRGEDRSLAAARALIEVLGKNKIQTDLRPSRDRLPSNTLKILGRAEAH